jgi:hypothetical protein
LVEEIQIATSHPVLKISPFVLSHLGKYGLRRVGSVFRGYRLLDELLRQPPVLNLLPSAGPREPIELI